MVPTRSRDDPARLGGFEVRGEGVVGPSEFERPTPLQVLGLEKNSAPANLVEKP